LSAELTKNALFQTVFFSDFAHFVSVASPIKKCASFTEIVVFGPRIQLVISSFLLFSSIDLSTVENEYIRNLQQQIYFLELECDYLRDQANRVVEIPNDITVEAAKLVKKLKV